MIIDKKSWWLQKVEESYNKIAKLFAVSRNYVWSDNRVFLDYIKEGNRVLDLGCGNGRLQEMLNEKKIEYVGVDASRELIAVAKENFPNSNFQVMNAVSLDNSFGIFDVVMSVSMLNHLTPDYHKLVFSNVFDILQPGGYFLLSNWNMWNVNNKKGVTAFQKEKNELSEAEFQKKYGLEKSDLQDNEVLTLWGDEQSPLYYYAFTVEELEALALKTGFQVLKIYYSKKGQPAAQNFGDNVVGIFHKPIN